MQDLWHYLGIDWTAALAVVFATTALYLAFVVLTRLLGQRVLANLSSFDLLVVMVLGAVIGRATMGHTPTLTGALIALVTLFALETVMGRLRNHPRWEPLLNNRPVLLMAGSEILVDELARFHITRAELRSRLRQAGIRNDDEVAAVVLEPTGNMSVLQRGFLVDPAMLEGVRCADRMPSGLLGD